MAARLQAVRAYWAEKGTRQNYYTAKRMAHLIMGLRMDQNIIDWCIKTGSASFDNQMAYWTTLWQEVEWLYNFDRDVDEWFTPRTPARG